MLDAILLLLNLATDLWLTDVKMQFQMLFAVIQKKLQIIVSSLKLSFDEQCCVKC